MYNACPKCEQPWSEDHNLQTETVTNPDGSAKFIQPRFIVSCAEGHRWSAAQCSSDDSGRSYNGLTPILK